MTGERAHWVWIFGERAGLRWVVEHQQMAFGGAGAARSTGLAVGDLAIIYVSRGAFHNPTRDAARLGGLAEVVGPLREDPVEIGGRDFTHQVAVQFVVLLAERSGPEVRPFVGNLDLVRNPSAWGTYFRTSPLKVTERDFNVMRDEVDRWSKEHPD